MTSHYKGSFDSALLHTYYLWLMLFMSTAIYDSCYLLLMKFMIAALWPLLFTTAAIYDCCYLWLPLFMTAAMYDCCFLKLLGFLTIYQFITGYQWMLNVLQPDCTVVWNYICIFFPSPVCHSNVKLVDFFWPRLSYTYIFLWFLRIRCLLFCWWFIEYIKIYNIYKCFKQFVIWIVNITH